MHLWRIGIGDHDIGGQTHPAFQFDADGAPRADHDARYRAPQLQPDALADHEPFECGYERTRATARKPHAPFLFEMRDQSVDRRGAERMPADQQRLQAEHLAQGLVADEAADQRRDRLVPAEANDRRQGAQHRTHRVEGLRTELVETDLVQRA